MKNKNKGLFEFSIEMFSESIKDSVGSLFKYFGLFQLPPEVEQKLSNEIKKKDKKTYIEQGSSGNTIKQTVQYQDYVKKQEKDAFKPKNRKSAERLICLAYFFIYFVLLFSCVACGAKHPMPISKYHNTLVMVYAFIISVVITPGFLKHFFRYMYSDVSPKACKPKAKPKYEEKPGFFEFKVTPLRRSGYGFWDSWDITKPIAYIMAILIVSVAFLFNMVIIASLNSALAYSKPVNRYVKVEHAEAGEYEVSDWRESGGIVSIVVDKNKPIVAVKGDIMLVETRIGILGLEYLNDQDSLECFDIEGFPANTVFPLTEEEFQKIYVGRKYKRLNNR